jgi:hypothetical protein
MQKVECKINPYCNHSEKNGVRIQSTPSLGSGLHSLVVPPRVL